MSETIALVSGIPILPDELIAVSHEIGATITPDDTFLARLSKQDKHVWIAISDEPRDEETLEDYAQALGTSSKTVVILEVSQTQGSMDLAVEFITKFSQRWPVIVDTLHRWNAVYTVNTFLDLYKKRPQT